MKKMFMFICLGMFCFGCAAIDSVTSQPGEDILLTTGDIDRPYKELGVVFVKGRCSRYEKITEELKAKAKEVGADAVIKIEFGKFRRSYRRHCRGVAVSFK
jgi:hypothetical protein